MPSRPAPRPQSSSLHTAGMVLAAGASTRMGSPKALLQNSAGVPLAAKQVELLRNAGCDPVTVVLGAEAEAVREALPMCSCTTNEAWQTGRVSSVQAGLRALGPADGYLILPVDAVGVSPTTLADVMHLGASTRARAIRPAYRERGGHLLWISADTAHDLLALESTPETRLDEWVGSKCMWVEMQDAALLNNINTPDDWAALSW